MSYIRIVSLVGAAALAAALTTPAFAQHYSYPDGEVGAELGRQLYNYMYGDRYGTIPNTPTGMDQLGAQFYDAGRYGLYGRDTGIHAPIVGAPDYSSNYYYGGSGGGYSIGPSTRGYVPYKPYTPTPYTPPRGTATR